MKILTYLIIVLVLIFGISFAVLNAESVVLDYYVGEIKLPLSLLMVLTLVLGCVLGVMVSGLGYLKLKSKNCRLQNQLKLLEKEISNLRKMPLQDNR